MRPEKVLLICMPFKDVTTPALGISLLKAELNKISIGCDIKYFNLLLAEQIGPKKYLKFIKGQVVTVGEWVFSHCLFGKDAVREKGFVGDILGQRDFQWRKSACDDETTRIYLDVKKVAESFLEQCMASVDWSQYSIVAFTSTFQQNVASLALAKKIKAQYSDKLIVFGGANCYDIKGQEMLKVFPFIDAVCIGEGDKIFSRFVKDFLKAKSTIKVRVPGIITRGANNGGVPSESNNFNPDLDKLPYPDFADYFDQLEKSKLYQKFEPHLAMESSRGCWWGSKSKCKFCGLNYGAMNFRKKSPDRVFSEIKYLTSKYQVNIIDMADNIMDMEYIDTLLPKLSKLNKKPSIFYEMKANLTKPQVERLAEAGVVAVQIGIESFSTKILKLMSKGSTAIHNIQSLKWCTEAKIYATWNWLFGVPGENSEEYTSMQKKLGRYLTHLPPPYGMSNITLDRYSSYFKDPAKYKIKNIRSLESQKYIYPFNENVLCRLTQLYDFDHGDRTWEEIAKYVEDIKSIVDYWKSEKNHDIFYSIDRGDYLLLYDRRSYSKRRIWKLRGYKRGVYEFCDMGRTNTEIKGYSKVNFGYDDIEINGFLRECVSAGVMVEDGGRYLSLAIRR